MKPSNKNNHQIYKRLESISNSLFQSKNVNHLTEDDLIQEVSKALRLSPLQTSMVALIATKGPDLEVITEAKLMQVFNAFGQSRSDIILSIKQLKRLHYISHGDMHDSEQLELDRRYGKFLENDDWDNLNSINAVGILPLLKRVYKLFHQEDHHIRRHFMFNNEIEDIDFCQELLLEENEGLTAIRKAKKYFGHAGWDQFPVQLYFYVLAQKVLADEGTEIDEFLNSKQINKWERKSFIHEEIISGNWPPIRDGFFELLGAEQHNDELEIGLTDLGIEQLLPELDAEILSSLLECKTITVPHKKPESIVKTKLLFDPYTESKLKPIQKALTPTIRAKIQQRLGERKLGITALLYGFPGTGKTEFCYQLAKEYDMPIFEVNVAQIQNKWVGESEKNARKVFQQYQKLKKQSKQDCILLFNEADALLGRRLNVHSSVDSMNNSVKNIFLEEIEKFEGVLLATTNLTENMDEAFERRFLFKVCFNKPDMETASKIWQIYFKGLSRAEALVLAKKFSFSPGEITNVHTRFEIERILGNRTKRIQLIEQLSVEERIKSHSNRSSNSVGFG